MAWSHACPRLTASSARRNPWAARAARHGTTATPRFRREAMATAEAAVLDAATIWQQVQAVYESAQANGAATKTETQTSIVDDAHTGLPWVIRLATALKSKPAAPPKDEAVATGSQQPWRNPFLPPDPALTVGPLSATHTLVLNKFNVVAHHCLVITREFQSQGEALNAADFSATWRLLQAMPAGLAFYNCGPASGRSQPHKHLQVVPLPLDDAPGVRGPDEQPPLWRVVADAAAAAAATPLTPLRLTALPWQAYAAILPDTPDADALAATTDALRVLATHECQPPRGPPPGGEQLSYNVLVTKRFLMLVPRSREHSGPLAINALGYAGTLLVKDVAAVDYVVHRGGPSAVLAEAGHVWSQALHGR